MLENYLKNRASSLVAIIFVSLATCSTSHGYTFVPDHYISYELKTGPFSKTTVTLQDKFIGPLDFRVHKPTQLLNPALSLNQSSMGRIKNEYLHYTAYDIVPTKSVRVDQNIVTTNEFGSFFLQQFSPSRLLVPTQKTYNLPNAFEKILQIADHYLCYDIAAQSITTNISLKDQFRDREFNGLIARRFCNPVEKTHLNQHFQIGNDTETNHLMCFNVDDKEIFKLATLHDQFSQKTGVVHKDDEICVPSTTRTLPTRANIADDKESCTAPANFKKRCLVTAKLE